MPGLDDQPEEVSTPSLSQRSVGELLQSSRKDQGRKIADIAAELRVESYVLEALEADRFTGLGAPVFVKGYIRQYGRQLGLDAEDLLAAYRRQADDGEIAIQPNRGIQLRDERQVTIWIVTGLVLLLLAVALFVWWVGDADALFGSGPTVRESTIGQPSAVPSTVEGGAARRSPAEPTSVPAEPAPRADGELDRVAATAPVVEASPAEPEPLDDVEETAAVPAAQTSPPEPSASPPPGPSPNATAVRVRFMADCWTEITDAVGNRLYYDLAAAGTEATLYGQLPMNFFFGNAEGVELTINDVAYPIPAGSRRGNLANFIVYPSTD
jgi:cytoskeleton protein RodZ